jgi:hypothetical protein
MTPVLLPDADEDRPARGDRRRWGQGLLALGAAVLLLPGCAALRQIGVDVVTYGAWPDKRSPGRYAIDRLPSQAAGGPERDQLEAAAAEALQQVGFRPAAGVAQADVLVQIDGRRSRIVSPYADPWWPGFRGGMRAAPPPDRRIHGSVGVGVGVGMGVGIGFGWDAETFERQQVQLLLVDRASRDRLVELQIVHEARYSGPELLPLLFQAGLQGFPALPAGPRRVTVQLP